MNLYRQARIGTVTTDEGTRLALELLTNEHPPVPQMPPASVVVVFDLPEAVVFANELLESAQRYLSEHREL